MSGPLGGMRRARPGDEPALSLIGSATFLEAFAGIIPGADILLHCRREHSEAKYAELMTAGALIWMAHLQQAPVGYMVMHQPDLPLPDIGPRDAEIKRIYLLGRCQGHGYGRAFMARAEADAHRAGKHRLLLGVKRDNDKAIGFYEAVGFTEVGKRKFVIGGAAYDDLIFAKPVEPPSQTLGEREAKG